MCLYVWPNGTWEVHLPLEEVPVEIREQVCGVNFTRDEIPKKVWISLIAIHCDAWLMSMAFTTQVVLHLTEMTSMSFFFTAHAIFLIFSYNPSFPSGEFSCVQCSSMIRFILSLLQLTMHKDV